MVLLNDFVRQWSDIRGDAAAALEAVGGSGHYILGPAVAELELQLARRLGTRHAIGVGNGLDAITIGLRATGCTHGARVLTTPLSAFATTLAVMQVGAVPCFLDVDPTGLLDLDLVEEALARASDRPYLLPVHLYGRALDLGRLRAIGERYDVCIVEDCAQAIGARQGEIGAGTVGLVAAFSFYPTKNLGCLGDGGALLTSNDQVAERARAMRNYGQSNRYVHDHFGINSRLDELQARILTEALLPRLAGWNQRRTAIARAYCRGIANPALALPPFLDGGSVWHLYPVLVQHGERASFQAHLAACGVQSDVHYPRIIPDQEALRAYGKFEILGPLSRARAFATQAVSLPIHPYLTAAEIDSVIAASNSWSPT